MFGTMKCKNCGKEIPDDSAFCTSCGHKIIKERGFRKKYYTPIRDVLFLSVFIAIAIELFILIYIQSFDDTVPVMVEGTVDVNLQQINGRDDVFFNNPRRGENDKYYLIPVTVE